MDFGRERPVGNRARVPVRHQHNRVFRRNRRARRIDNAHDIRYGHVVIFEILDYDLIRKLFQFSGQKFAAFLVRRRPQNAGAKLALLL